MLMGKRPKFHFGDREGRDGQGDLGRDGAHSLPSSVGEALRGRGRGGVGWLRP